MLSVILLQNILRKIYHSRDWKMKRLQTCRSAILSGASITYIYELYGFRDYSAFFRAFKKEYGISPKEYRDISQASLSAQEAAPE